jgi:2'-5' RNA ligase
LAPLLRDIARVTKSFGAEWKGVASFPGKGPPQVIHLTVGDPDQGWERLFRGLSAALEPLGFPLETKVFRPHLTLARLGKNADGVKALATYRSTFEGFNVPWRVEDFHLIESILKPGGAEYVALESFPLEG